TEEDFMDLKLVFRIAAVIFLINAFGIIFMPNTFFEMAGLTMSDSLKTVGQFLGITIVFIALLSWRIPDIAGNAFSALGQLWGIGNLLWFLMVSYHVMTGQAGGSTAYINIALFAVFAVLFFMYSRKSE
ncbi:MAG: hypothetical protein QGI89_05235, partial [Candidatus Woesearchaeota archaeon]|nr:hypothetical protein [Candidatus Woesearchaeota archaeon]